MVMNRAEAVPVVAVSIILVVYAVLIFFETWLVMAGLIFTLSPILVMWLVYNVIRNGKYSGRELDENEEWGYTDRA
jgi:uncharacterized RDD family membrane protein YckC